MEVTMKYPLNPLAACFVPLSMKAQTENISGDVSSKFRKSTPIYKLKYEALLTNKNKSTDNSALKTFDPISKQTTCEDLCYTYKRSEMNALVHKRATLEKLISDEASIDRSEDRTRTKKMDSMEQKVMTGTSSMELERTSKLDNENANSFETERTSDMDNNKDSIKMIRTSNMASESTDFDTEDGNLCTALELDEKLVDYDAKPGQHASISSTESIQSTKSNQSDYGTDFENIETEDISDLSRDMTSFKSIETTESERETTKLASDGSERNPSREIKNTGTLNLYMTALLSSILPSENSKIKACSKETKTGSKVAEDCGCPPMFGWIIPFDCLGNPLNLTGTCKKNYVHTTYQHAVYDHTAGVQTIYRKSCDFGNRSIDSGHCSDEDEPSSSVEVNTLEQCSLELESIIKDVFDCVDKSLSLCEDEKPDEADYENSNVWMTANQKEVFQAKDSPVIDDGNHPLLEEIASKGEVNKGISIIEKLLGEALAFDDKHISERYSSKSPCILPCSVWCTKVPPSAIDTYKRFVKKIDSDPVNRNVADKKVFGKPIYKRCFSANDAPKGFDIEIQRPTSSWEYKAGFCQKDFSAFKDSKDTANNFLSSNLSSEQPTNQLKKRSDKWSLYDGADSLWQPLPDCVLSNDHTQKYAYKRAQLMRRQKSVG